jgi:hypothetical protein
MVLQMHLHKKYARRVKFAAAGKPEYLRRDGQGRGLLDTRHV